MLSLEKHTTQRLEGLLRIVRNDNFYRYHCPRRWMSVRPEKEKGAGDRASPLRKKVTIADLHALRAAHTPITMLTAYDYPTARTCSSLGIDITLVGDSLAQVCLGYPSTTRLTLSELLHHTRAVARGTSSPLLIADMPFGAGMATPEDAVRAAVRIVQEGHADGVKLEGGREMCAAVKAMTSVGVPVMAHVGLMPQRHVALSGFRAQGRDAAGALKVLEDALALEEAGAFAVVLEAVPAVLGTYVTKRMKSAVTIGIGAGAGTDGQVLVWVDMLGAGLGVGEGDGGHQPRFVRRFANVGGEVARGVNAYMEAVRERSFPGPRECYEMPKAEWERFEQLAKAYGGPQDERP